MAPSPSKSDRACPFVAWSAGFRRSIGVWLGLLVAFFLPPPPACAAPPEPVLIGVYLRNVDAIDFEDNTYNLDFDLWMVWEADLAPPPTDTFRFVNVTEYWGLSVLPLHMDADRTPAPRRLSDGRMYQRFHVEGIFYHKFWLGTHPLDWQKFTIDVEDTLRDRDQLRYVADVGNSALDPEFEVPGWQFMDLENEERVVQPPTNFGDVDRPAGNPLSHYRFGVRLYRPARYFFLKILPPLFLVFLTATLIFFLPDPWVDSRLGVVITGFLSEIFLQLTYSTGLPSISIPTITDMIYNLAYLLLMAAFVLCVLTARIFARQERLEEELAADELDEGRRITLQTELDKRKRTLRRTNFMTALGLSLLMLFGTVAIVLIMRGPAQILW